MLILKRSYVPPHSIRYWSFLPKVSPKPSNHVGSFRPDTEKFVKTPLPRSRYSWSLDESLVLFESSNAPAVAEPSICEGCLLHRDRLRSEGSVEDQLLRPRWPRPVSYTHLRAHETVLD